MSCIPPIVLRPPSSSVSLTQDGKDNGYLTRRIRRQVYGPDVASVQEKQITVPLVISHELENHLLADIPQCYANFPDQTFRQPSLIHVYNPVTHDPATSPLPALSDTADEFGNLRYLVVSNENLWAGQHYVTDVFFELFWLFFSLFALPSHIEHRFAQPSSLDSKLSILCLAQYLRCRIILPEIPYNAHETVLPSHLPLREALLFRAWIHDRPKLSNMYYAEEVGKHQMYSNTSPFEVGPPADNLFWEAGDEGEWDEEGVPQWTDAEVEGSSQGDQMREE
ncbi:hypothetical protein MMC12_002288 [Toensbergia leucococca]|nr:hypothetical protein [Toensbergia leucococca]